MFVLKKKYVDKVYWNKILSVQSAVRKGGLRFYRSHGKYYVVGKTRSVGFSTAEKLFKFIKSRDERDLLYHLSL